VATFSDSAGDQWSVAFTIAQARRMKSDLSIDINNPKELAAGLDDLYQRFDLLWMCCQPQAQERGLTALDFDARISPVFAAACSALTEALADFFRQSGQTRMVALLGRVAAVADQVEAAALEKLNSPQTDAAITRVVNRARDQIDRELAKIAPTKSFIAKDREEHPEDYRPTGGNGSRPQLQSSAATQND